MNENVKISDKKKYHHIPNEVKSLILCFVLLLGSSVKNKWLLCRPSATRSLHLFQIQKKLTTCWA